MAIKYQKADKVRGTSDEGEAGDKIFVEKYNKLAKAFNERLSYGVGDTTWRLFFYAHSLFRSMVLPKFGLKSADLGIIESEAEDGWWKLYSHIVPEPSMFKEDGYKDPERNDTHMFSWPKDNIANKYGGPNPSNHLVTYIYGTGGGVVNNYFQNDVLPPEWFRTQLVKLELDYVNTSAVTKEGAAQWLEMSVNGTEDEDVATTSPVESFIYYDPILNPKNLESEGDSQHHAPRTLAEMWLMAKIQRGVVVPSVNLDDSLFQFKSAMTHAAAPAYMTARWYYDYHIHWRSPFGKVPPSYAPSPSVVDLCQWFDERFPPTPVLEYIFSPINPDTHEELRFKTSCGGAEPNKIMNVRREYDHYHLMFADGHHTDPLTGERKLGDLKLPYKHYYEGPYTGGGKLEKREAHKDQMDSVLNFFNSGFRKHMSANLSREIFSKYLAETTEAKTATDGEFQKKYTNLSEATFDVPTWGFEFEKFFEKQYSLAPSFGYVYWQDSWEKKDGEMDMLYEPSYPTFTFFNNSSSDTTLFANEFLDLYVNWQEPVVEGVGDLQGPYGENNFSLETSFVADTAQKFFPIPPSPSTSFGIVDPEDVPVPVDEQWKHYCLAGYYIVGCGIKVQTTTSGTTPTTLQFTIEEYKYSDTSSAQKTQTIGIDVKVVPDTGYCVDSGQSTKEECLAANSTWIEEGVFEKLYYMARGEDIALKERCFAIKTNQDITFLKKPALNSGNYERDSKLSSNSWSGISMETAILLRMRPDLPDALLLLRLSSSGLGSDRTKAGFHERWGGDDEGNTIDSALLKGIDTKGDMMFSTLKKDNTPDISKAPKKIWQNYEDYGIIKNLFGMPNLPHKLTKSAQQDNAMKDTYLNLMAEFSTGQSFSSQNYINFNPIYDSAREMFHRHLRMIPRTSLEDYEVIYDEEDYVCKYQSEYQPKKLEKPEVENKLECTNLGEGHSWEKGRTKSVLTFNRYVDLYGDPNMPEVEGMYKQELEDEPKAPNRIAPAPEGGG